MKKVLTIRFEIISVLIGKGISTVSPVQHNKKL